MMDLAVINADVHTMNAEMPRAEAVAVKFRKIAAVGSNEEVKELCDEETKVVDAGGRCLLPGFMDSHMHPFIAAAFLSGMNLSKVGSIEELKETLEGELENGEGMVMGYGWNLRWLEDDRFPTRWDLDEVAPETPVYLIDYSGHTCVVNSAYLRKQGINSNTQDPQGGEIVRDESGEPTGILRENACQHLADPSFMINWGGTLSLEELTEMGKEILSQAPKLGLTTITDAIVVGDTMRAYYDLLRSGSLDVRVNMMVWYKLLNHLKSLGIESGFGDDMLKIAGVKIVQDGSMSGHSAALEAPYDNEPSTRGVVHLDQEELTRVVREASDSNLRLFVHAIGDRAIRMSLDAFQDTLVEPEDIRFRIEHCLLWNQELIERCAELGVIVDVPPVFMMSGKQWMPDCVGSKREKYAYPWRSLLDAGVRLCFHTDYMVEPMDPIMNIYAAVTRKDKEGEPAEGDLPDQRITVEEAVRALTIDGAYAAKEEDIKGSIEEGKMADMVILSADPFQVPPEDIKNIDVEMTILGGEIVFEK